MNFWLLTFCIITVFVFEVSSNNLLEAYFRHRAAHHSIHNRLLSTNGRNHVESDSDEQERARQPGSFVSLHESRLSFPVSAQRDELRAASMIQMLHAHSKRLAGHI